MLSPGGLPVPLVRQVGKIRVTVRRTEDHASATSSVAPVRAAARRVFLMAKTEAAVASIPTPHEDRHSVDKHGSGIWNPEIGDWNP
jgi:hypothetical protein